MPLTTTIDDAWLESEAPTTKKSHRSYVKAFVPAGLVYAGLALIAHSAIWLAKKARLGGWSNQLKLCCRDDYRQHTSCSC